MGKLVTAEKGRLCCSLRSLFYSTIKLGEAIMEACSSKPSAAPPFPTQRPAKRLLFDRRYGWVFDEWKDPSEEALAGGRGMFCILPIATSLLNVASSSINLAAESVVRGLNSPNQFSPQELHANMCCQFHKLAHNVQRWNRKLTALANGKQNAMHSAEDPTN